MLISLIKLIHKLPNVPTRWTNTVDCAGICGALTQTCHINQLVTRKKTVIKENIFKDKIRCNHGAVAHARHGGHHSFIPFLLVGSWIRVYCTDTMIKVLPALFQLGTYTSNVLQAQESHGLGQKTYNWYDIHILVLSVNQSRTPVWLTALMSDTSRGFDSRSSKFCWSRRQCPVLQQLNKHPNYCYLFLDCPFHFPRDKKK